MKKRILALLLSLGLATSMLASCGSSEDSSDAASSSSASSESTSASSEGTSASSEGTSDSAEAVSSDTDVVYTNTGPVEFFEHAWANAGQYVHTKLLFETLIGMDENMDPTTESGMAESYVLSDDGMTLTVTLREGLKWHDGEDVTTDDVIWSMKAVLDETMVTLNLLKTVMSAIEGADEVTAGTSDTLSGVTVDGNTITIQFAEVSPNALLGFSLFHILPEHCLADADLSQFQQDSFWQAPIGSGPFVLEEVRMGEYAYFVPFEDYWAGTASFNVLSWASTAEADENLVTNVLSGQIDYAYTKTYADVQALRDEEGVNIHTVSVNYTRWLIINEYKKDENTENPLADVRVRQAIAYAIDREAICEEIFEGAAMPGDGTLTPTGSAWKVEGLESYDYDPDKAIELLEEAGWDSSQVLDLVYYYTDQQTVDLMAVIQQYLAQVGINVEPRLLEGDYVTQMNLPPSSTDSDGISGVEWDLAYGALSATSVFDYYERFGSTNSANIATPATEELDGYLAELTSTADVDAQKEAFAKIEAYHAENMLYVPLYYQPVWVVTSNKIDSNIDVWGNPQFGWNWGIESWVLEG